jgi:hypothetical protein
MAPDMKSISANPDGTFTAKVTVGGTRRQKTFPTDTAARTWRDQNLAAKGVRDLPVGVYRVGKRFRAEVLVGGQRARQTFDSAAEAKGWRDVAETALNHGLPTPVPGAVSTRPRPERERVTVFEIAAQRWFDHHYRQRIAAGRVQPQTYRASKALLEDLLLPALGALLLEDVERELYIEGLRDAVAARGYSKDTQRRLLWMARATFNYANAEGWSNRNPGHGVEPHVPNDPTASARRAGRSPGRDARYVPLAETKALAGLVHPTTRSPCGCSAPAGSASLRYSASIART